MRQRSFYQELMADASQFADNASTSAEVEEKRVALRATREKLVGLVARGADPSYLRDLEKVEQILQRRMAELLHQELRDLFE